MKTYIVTGATPVFFQVEKTKDIIELTAHQILYYERTSIKTGSAIFYCNGKRGTISQLNLEVLQNSGALREGKKIIPTVFKIDIEESYNSGTSRYDLKNNQIKIACPTFETAIELELLLKRCVVDIIS